MVKRADPAEELRERILAAMRADIGISERMALPFVESVMRCFAGERTYFPAERRQYPVDVMREALQAGSTPQQICRKYGVSRRQLNRLFAGGLPKKKAAS